MPKNGRSFTTQLHQIEAARSVLEGKEECSNSGVTVFSGSDCAGDKETRKSSSAGVALVGRHSFESVHKKTEDHRQKQRRGRAVCSSIGSVRSEGDPERDA